MLPLVHSASCSGSLSAQPSRGSANDHVWRAVDPLTARLFPRGSFEPRGLFFPPVHSLDSHERWSCSTPKKGCRASYQWPLLKRFMAMHWFRMWVDAIDDEKLRLLAFEDRWHFVAILCLKSSGLLDEPPSDLRRQKICIKLGLDSLELETVMKRLVTVGLVSSDLQPVKWNKRQFVSDSSTKRVRKFRERLRNVSVAPSEDRLQKQNTETEKKEDRSARAPRSARATRLPEDFQLTPERRAVAETEKADPDREFANFVDHWKAASGAKARKNDWDATWRIWCRRAPDFKPRPRRPDDFVPERTWRPTDEDVSP